MQDTEPADALASAGHEPPQIVRLGTLAELTQGGTVGADDGFGGAGDASIL